MKLDQRTIRLIAIGAAMGANCQSCLEANSAKALESGALEQEIAEAIQIGKMVRSCAASRMDEIATRLSESGPYPVSLSKNSECGCEASLQANTGGQNG